MKQTQIWANTHCGRKEREEEGERVVLVAFSWTIASGRWGNHSFVREYNL